MASRSSTGNLEGRETVKGTLVIAINYLFLCPAAAACELPQETRQSNMASFSRW